MEEQEKNIQDYLIAIRKRKSAIMAIFTVIVSITVLIALLLPSIYKSSSTILIEQQEIPAELVMSTVTSYAAERIRIIQARVMTRTNLLKIVDKFGLYKNERKVETTEQIVGRMHEDVSLDLISAEVVDPRTGRPSAATIAFSLGFQGESPSKVQRVANELTTLYLNENLTSRVEKASEASVFFQEEAKRLRKEMNGLEEKLVVFKQKNANALPELQQLNLSVLQRKETEVTSLDTQLRVLDEKRTYLTGQLALIEPGNPDTPGSVERLKMLRSQFATVSTRYSSEHPDVIRLKTEIDSLQKAAGQTDDVSVIADTLNYLKGKLEYKRQTYTADHPDIISLERKIKALNSELQQANNNPLDEYYKEKPGNPLYITIESQIAGVESETRSITMQRKETLDRMDVIEKSLYDAPQVAREYSTLSRDYRNAVSQYQETKAKQMRTDIAMQLESESKAEKFTLIDPAILPEKPVSPNRSAIVFLGIILALGGGLGFAIVADTISGTVRGIRSIQLSLGALPLSVIPYELNLQDRVKTKRIKKRIVVLFIVVIVVAVLFIHLVVSPLDVLWFRVLRKIDILMA